MNRIDQGSLSWRLRCKLALYRVEQRWASYCASYKRQRAAHRAALRCPISYQLELPGLGEKPRKY